jgi:hypothetical protein
MTNTRASQALFRKVGEDGADWLFVIRSHDGWAITRNGEEVEVGERASVAAGVGKFMSLTRVVVASDAAACDPAVGALLDRIEQGRPAAVKTAKSHERSKPRALKEASDHLNT